MQCGPTTPSSCSTRATGSRGRRRKGARRGRRSSARGGPRPTRAARERPGTTARCLCATRHSRPLRRKLWRSPRASGASTSTGPGSRRCPTKSAASFVTWSVSGTSLFFVKRRDRSLSAQGPRESAESAPREHYTAHEARGARRARQPPQANPGGARGVTIKGAPALRQPARGRAARPRGPLHGAVPRGGPRPPGAGGDAARGAALARHRRRFGSSRGRVARRM
mmetsp:Transcript_10468/g.28418  ORF Transcript_10468/g.28418 Transcript_10468/m.28418 type:complete len:224 (+) Transcript_10468:1084-1755(+)